MSTAACIRDKSWSQQLTSDQSVRGTNDGFSPLLFTFSRLLAVAGLQATDVQQTWIEAAALGAQQPLPAAASTGCALPLCPLPDLLQKGNQGKPLTDCSLPPPMVLAAAAAPNFLPGNRAAQLQATEASSNSPAMLRRQVALLQEQTAGIR